MHVVLLAGGKNERFKQLSIFPKVILPFMLDNKSTTILKYYADAVDELTVVINSKYEQMVKGYVSANNLDNVKVVRSSNQDGSFWTLNEVFKSELDSAAPHLFIWSDLIIDTTILKRKYQGNVLFTRYGKYRLKAFHGKITPAPNNDGNIPGVFYIESWFKFFDQVNSNHHSLFDEHNFDLANAFHFTEFKAKPIKSKIIELRDLEAYTKFVRNQKILTRGFNEIIFRTSSVTKRTDNKHKHLIANEVSWYQSIPQYNLEEVTPKLLCFSDKSITLSRLDKSYKPLFTFGYNSEDKIIQKLLNTVYDTFARTNAIVLKQEDYASDVIIELKTKTLARLNQVKDMILEPVQDIEIESALQKAVDIILEESEPVYHFFHGDLNGSNIMYNGKDFKFLDPRGYFGNTKKFGPIWYERAKIIYAVTGYDAFNQQFNYAYINKNKYSKPIRLFLDFDEINSLDKIVVGIIYMSLTSYIADNIMKVNIAYQYGWKLLNEGLNQYITEKEYNL